MIVNGREIIFKTRFLKEVNSISNYLLQHTQQGTEQFLAELEQLVFDKIPKQPTAFPEFQKKPTKAKVYRKALCRKKWNVIYKIEPKRILFIYIYHSSRNIDRIKI